MIFLGADHRGFQMKEHIKAFLEERNLSYTDMGTKSEERTDYTDYAFAVAERVAQAQQENREDVGILLCGSGVGICIAANKVKGARAALATNEFMSRHARENDDANILVLPSQVVSEDEAAQFVQAFLQARFDEEEGHARRIQKIEEYEQAHWQ